MMEQRPGALPAGWYPVPDGGQRYWDGRTWLEIPAPDVVSPQPLSGAADPAPKKRNRRIWIAVVSGVLVVAGLSIGGYAAKNVHDATQAALITAQDAKARDEQAAEAKMQADAAEAQKAADAEKAKQAQAAKDKAERRLRKEAVSEIEKSVKKMAKGHAKDGVIDGPIVEVSCDPVAGGSVDDLSEKTTAFQCFAANKRNKDGTSSGYYYHATMNWNTGSYTYGLGKD